MALNTYTTLSPWPPKASPPAKIFDVLRCTRCTGVKGRRTLLLPFCSSCLWGSTGPRRRPVRLQALLNILPYLESLLASLHKHPHASSPDKTSRDDLASTQRVSASALTYPKSQTSSSLKL